VESMLETKAPSHNDLSKDHGTASLYLIAFGVGYLFPFSALTQPVDYWNYLFPGYNMGTLRAAHTSSFHHLIFNMRKYE